MSADRGRFDFQIEESGGGIPAPLRDPIGVWHRRWRWTLVAFLVLVIPAIFLSRLIPLEYEAASSLMLTGKAIPDEYVPETIVASVSEQFKAIENRVMTRENLREIIVARDAFKEEREASSLASVVREFRQAVAIDEKVVRNTSRRESSIAIRVSLQGRDPVVVADLVNDIGDDLIAEFLEYRGEQSQVTSNFMRREFEAADEDLRQHQRILAEFRAKNRGSLPEEQLTTIGKLERLESQRRSLILQINDATADLRSSGSTTSLGGVVISPREALQTELDRLRGLYTEEHPQLQSVKRQIAAIDEGGIEGADGTLGRPASDSRARIMDEIAARRARLNEIDLEVNQLERQVARTSGITEEYRALERKEVILQEAYTDYLRKLKAAELSRSLELARQGTQLVRLESAIPPSGPIVPRILFTGAAVLAALLGSLVVAVAGEFLNPVVIDSDHLEQITSLPCLGSLPPVSEAS